ncbi:MAG: hypothetical protein U5J63_16545 [Fodinibius sp.]|nr:hypothetical protein [Fodinibius sp.]
MIEIPGRFEGVVSGTMTYLFNQLEQGTPFSKAIIDARKKGYAEPDRARSSPAKT